MTSFYMDDMLESVDTKEEAIQLAKDTESVLRAGCFNLRKWNSNDASVVAAMTGQEAPADEVKLEDESMSSVLGLKWQPCQDEFSYKVDLDDTNVHTKKTCTSTVARLWDPPGFLAPALILGKIFLQSLWKEKLDWDDPLPEALREEWIQFQGTLTAINEIRIPRWMGMSKAGQHSFHGFCDASQRAYAAVIYVRCVDESGAVSVSLVAARTKVAPVKEMSIPRLELCGAQLLAQLWLQVCKAMGCDDDKVTFYTDSTIALAWIRNSPSEWKEFVSNRVGFIQKSTDRTCWRHVRTENNPADCASRGISAAALKKFQLWWHGPEQLMDPRMDLVEELPVVMSDRDRSMVAMEQKPVKVNVTTSPSVLMTTTQPGASVNDSGLCVPLVDRFSDLLKLQRTTALVLRMCPSHQSFRGSPFITTVEFERAMNLHIKQAQQMYLGNELKLLQSQQPVSPGSQLSCLNPYLDENGLIRVSGRLRNSKLPFRQKHPLIIPRESAICKLLIDQAHRFTLHGGIQEMLQYIRKTYWIVTGRKLVKSHINRCKTCKLHSRSTEQQQMASLPNIRVDMAPPFYHTGVDYCGPFLVRVGGPRSRTLVKVYVSVMICMVTRSVHLDLGDDLSTRAFFDVYDRFVNRRGICKTMHSDNGTQFLGASRQMKKDLEHWRGKEVYQYLADNGTEWKFITPAAPFHGGLWEAAVKSTKKHLLKVVGQRVLTYNQLATLLVKIEGILNSRPLIALHDDLESGLALTPAHFLVGRPILSRPENYSGLDVPENRLNQYETLRKMHLEFWRLWQRDYLNELQARGKWCRPHPNLCVGDVVAIKDENLPPTQWRIGRISSVHPGSDGLVRTVDIVYNSAQTNGHGLFTLHTCQRPVQKVCRLVTAEEDVLDSGPAGQDV